MCSEPMPKEFEKTTEVLPITKYGITTYKEFKEIEEEIQHREWLKKVGLSNEEIKLYEENEAGHISQQDKIEASVLKSKLEVIYEKINSHQDAISERISNNDQPSTSAKPGNILDKYQKKQQSFYPADHPMSKIKELEESLFGHLKNNEILPLTKRRKMLRRLERKKQRIMSQEHQLVKPIMNSHSVNQPGSLWDLKESDKVTRKLPSKKETQFIGPKKQTMYTIKNNKIIRLEPVKTDERNKANNEDDHLPNDAQNDIEGERQVEYRAVDIVLPINNAEEQLLEGTKMSVDDIKKIERFKDYKPGVPSKVLYLKNIAPSVVEDQLSLLFNQFVLENGGPIDVRLMSGRMRGQAFVSFSCEDLAIRALEEVNGTILSRRPIVAQFGRNSNRIQDDNR